MAVKKNLMTSNDTCMIQLRAGRSLFSCLAIIAQTRSMDMYVVLAFPLGQVPWSLASPDGSLVKTNKAKLLHYLEEDCQLLTVLSPSSWILDGMAILQSLQGSSSTFADLASVFLQLILMKQHTTGCHVVVVFDYYWDVSIKATEWQR